MAFFTFAILVKTMYGRSKKNITLTKTEAQNIKQLYNYQESAYFMVFKSLQDGVIAQRARVHG